MSIIGAVLSLFVYFIPTIIAHYRNHNNLLSIMVLNIFLGWTFLGWIVALFWSLFDVFNDKQFMNTFKRNKN